MNQVSEKEQFSLPKSFPFAIYDASIPNQGIRTMQWHDCLEINYIQEGNGTYIISDTRYEIEPGQIFVINNNELHCAYTTSALKILCIVFEPGFVTGNALVDQDYLEPFFERNVNFHNQIQAKSALAQTIRDCAYEIEQENEAAEEGYQLMIKASLLRILALLYRHFKLEGQLGHDYIVHQNRLDRIREAVTYIEAHYQEKINLEDIAQLVFMNPSYFSTYFKKVMRISVVDYIFNLRMSAAVQMLTDSTIPITEVCLHCGFQTPAYFSRSFRKTYGQSPSQFRKSVLLKTR